MGRRPILLSLGPPALGFEMRDERISFLFGKCGYVLVLEKLGG